jgi:hypothetical protein
MQREIVMTIKLQVDDEAKSAKTTFTAEEKGKKKTFYSFTDSSNNITAYKTDKTACAEGETASDSPVAINAN